MIRSLHEDNSGGIFPLLIASPDSFLITHGFNQQVAQGFIIKRDFAKYIKNFSAEGLPLFLKF